LESSLSPGTDTEVRPVRRPEATPDEAVSRVPALPELPPLAPDPPCEPAPPKKASAATKDVVGPAPAKVEPSVTTCPRCQGKLVDAAGLGWCQSCGYCHSLEQDRAKAPVAAPIAAGKRKKPSSTEFLVLLVNVPSWFWTMLGGVVIVIGVTVLTAKPFRPTPFAQCLWCTLQIGLGALVMFLASFWALLSVASEDETMSAKDMFLPGRLWSLTCKRLPRTRWQVWLAVWGVTAILSAAVLVGGLGEWLKYLPKSKAEISPPGKIHHA